MIGRVMTGLLAMLASSGAAFAAPASLEEVTAAFQMFFPLPAEERPRGLAPVALGFDASAAIAEGLEGMWYRVDILGSVDPEIVAKACARTPNRITVAPDEITITQESPAGNVPRRYTYMSGSLYSEWVDIRAMIARLGLDKIEDSERRRQTELTVRRTNGGLAYLIRSSANVLMVQSLAGGPSLYARCP